MQLICRLNWCCSLFAETILNRNLRGVATGRVAKGCGLLPRRQAECRHCTELSLMHQVKQNTAVGVLGASGSKLETDRNRVQTRVSYARRSTGDGLAGGELACAISRKISRCYLLHSRRHFRFEYFITNLSLLRGCHCDGMPSQHQKKLSGSVAIRHREVDRHRVDDISLASSPHINFEFKKTWHRTDHARCDASLPAFVIPVSRTDNDQPRTRPVENSSVANVDPCKQRYRLWTACRGPLHEKTSEPSKCWHQSFPPYLRL